MSVLVIRHGLSEANNRHNRGALAFAGKEAPLMEGGKEQARLLGKALVTTHGIAVAETAVAVSQLKRSQETATEAGFVNLSVYSLLDEVVHGMELTKLRRLLDGQELPATALEAAHTVLENPPAEGIWITHGLVIAGLCRVLGVAQDARLIPKFCEIRELPIGPAATV